jgi:uncharacterized protein YyaL (SSP411 family)
LCELGLATGNSEFVTLARTLVDTVMEVGVSTMKDPVLVAQGLAAGETMSEGASPSGHSLLALAALRLAGLTGDEGYREFAKEQVAPHVADAMLNPLGYGGVLRVLSELASPQREVLVIADGASQLAGTVQKWRGEGAVTAVVNSEQARAFAQVGFSLFDGRTDGSTPIAYVCEAGVCRLPVTDTKELLALLAG